MNIVFGLEYMYFTVFCDWQCSEDDCIAMLDGAYSIKEGTSMALREAMCSDHFIYEDCGKDGMDMWVVIHNSKEDLISRKQYFIKRNGKNMLYKEIK